MTLPKHKQRLRRPLPPLPRTHRTHHTGAASAKPRQPARVHATFAPNATRAAKNAATQGAPFTFDLSNASIAGEPVSLWRHEPGTIVGPLPAGTTKEDHGLTVIQADAQHAAVMFGPDTLAISSPVDSVYSYFIEPAPPVADPDPIMIDDMPFVLIQQANEPPQIRQRVVRVAAMSRVSVEFPFHHEGDTGDQLIVHVRWITDEKAADELSESVVDPHVREEPQDDGGIKLGLDEDRILIRMPTSPDYAGARYAYYIDPLWGGEGGLAKLVHIVASPGITIEQHKVDLWLQRNPTLGSYNRTLVPEIIRVPHPQLVPEQGEPIRTEDYLSYEQFDATQSVPGAPLDHPANFLAATGSSGVVIKHEDGVNVSIRPSDPSVGAAYAWEALPRSQLGMSRLRIVVGPNVHIEVDEPPPSYVPRDYEGKVFEGDMNRAHHGDSMGTLDLKIVEMFDPSLVPVQGTPLNLTYYLDQGGHYRDPDEYQWVYERSHVEEVMIGAFETVIGFVPYVGELYYIAEFVYGAATGEDFWGRKLGTGDLVMMGGFAALAFIGAVARGVSSVARAAKLLEAARSLGTTPEEAEIVLSQLTRTTTGSDRQVLARATAALRYGGDIAEDDAKVLADLMKRFGGSDALIYGSRFAESLPAVGMEGEALGRVGQLTGETEAWYEGLSDETRALLQENRELAAEYEAMDPRVRRLLTRCASPCIPEFKIPDDQIDRILKFAEKAGIQEDTWQERQVRYYLSQRRGDLNKAIGQLERGVDKGTLTQLLDDQRAADVILMKRSQLITEEALKLQVDQAVRNGIDPYVLANAVDKAKVDGAATRRMIQHVAKLGELKATKQIPGIDAVVADLGRGGNWTVGAMFMLDWLEGADKWEAVKAFEVVEAVGDARREVDAIIDGTRYQFKSWLDFAKNKNTFVSQFERDYKLTRELQDPLKWVFDAKRGLNTKKAIIAAAQEALVNALDSAGNAVFTEDQLSKILGELPNIIEVR